MAHAFSLKEIALQAGLGLATVDRVIHARGGVRPSTAARVHAAKAELERQQALAGLSGRRLVIDLLIEAPDRFSHAVREALETELPALRPANIRCRSHMAEYFGDEALVRILMRITKRGSQGVLLKAADTPVIRSAVAEVRKMGVPVIAFATEIGGGHDVPYVGMQNQQAGATAAWCMGNVLGSRQGKILVTLSSAQFRGEQIRLNAFQRVMREEFGTFEIVVVSEGFGLDRKTAELARQTLSSDGSINAVYSSGGGNKAILGTFDQMGRECLAFIAHDLDQENRKLLRQGRINAVIHHDLRQDTRSACQMILKHHKMLPGEFSIPQTRVELATIHNMIE